MDNKSNTATVRSGNQLNLIMKLHQRSVVHRINEIDWESGSSSSPSVVELDPTTACNLVCPDCISRDLLNQGFFTRKRMRELTKEIVDAGVKAVVLIGGGEPLAHPEIGWVIEYLAQNNVHVGITTNGLLIDRYIDCIAEYASWVRVSMDSATSGTYKHIRPSQSGVSMFEKAFHNMRSLAKIKHGKLGYSFALFSECEFDINGHVNVRFSNVPEIYKGAVLAKEIGCDYFEVKPTYNMDHHLIIHPEELMQKAKHLLKQSSALEDKKFSVLQGTKLGHVLNCESDIEPKDYNRCAVAQLRTLITPSGVYVCPYFRGRIDKKLGDARKMLFNDIWHGKDRANVMESLNPSKDCLFHCIRHDSNMVIEDIIAGKSTVESVEDFDEFI